MYKRQLDSFGKGLVGDGLYFCCRDCRSTAAGHGPSGIRHHLHRLVDGIEQKYCGGCDRWQPLDCFYKASIGGLQIWCKDCLGSYCQEWREDNPERVAVNIRRWGEEHPKELAALRCRADRRRRALLRGVETGSYKDLDIYARDQYTCQICQEPLGDKPRQIDHFHPVSQGGSDTYENVRATHALCNQQKGDKTPTPEEEIAWAVVVQSWKQSTIELLV